MALFRHPHLVRGVVHTHHGAFAVVRGLVELPEEIGESLGWRRFEDPTSQTHPTPQTSPDHPVQQRISFNAR